MQKSPEAKKKGSQKGIALKNNLQLTEIQEQTQCLMIVSPEH